MTQAILRSIALLFICLLFIVELRCQSNRDLITNMSMNKRFCQSDANCRRGERCEKICFWMYPDDAWIGCKIVCVRTIVGRPPYFYRVTDLPLKANSTSQSTTTNIENLFGGIKRNISSNSKTTAKSLDFNIKKPVDDEPKLQFNISQPSSAEIADSIENQSKCINPPLCDNDCGVYLDSDGCQNCLCIEKGPIRCVTDTSCYSWQECSNGFCKCKFGYEESENNPGQCLPLIHYPLISQQTTEVTLLQSPKDSLVNDTKLTSNSSTRIRLSAGNGKLSDRCKTNKNCASDLRCCPTVFCTSSSVNCSRVKVCLKTCSK